jgi:hypothetical protein
MQGLNQTPTMTEEKLLKKTETRIEIETGSGDSQKYREMRRN